MFPEIREVIFGRVTKATIDNELMYYAVIDQAHLYALYMQGVVPLETVKILISTIRNWVGEEFASFQNLEAVRGVYLLYERALIEEHGVDVGGVLQTGRSRNDLNATVMRLRLRGVYEEVLSAGFEFAKSLTERANVLREVLFPAYTHYQTAFPTTVGHYLAAIAVRLERDLEYLENAFEAIDTCPLGCGAGGGTSIPIDAEWTANTLGFSACAENSIDAVASRDLILRVLSSAAVLSVTLTRMTTDIALWSTNEFNLVKLPDELVGSSSNMPQKRNPFLLEHMKGMSAAIISASNTALTCSLGTPFGNSVTVSGEATRHVWEGCRLLKEMLMIVTYTVRYAEFNEARAKEVIEKGYADSVYLAEKSVLEDKIPFRLAHERVGEMVRQASLQGVSLQEVSPATVVGLVDGNPPEKCIEKAVRSMKYGAGTGVTLLSEDRFLNSVNSTRQRLEEKVSRRVHRWLDAKKSLDQLIDRLHLKNGNSGR